MKRISNKEFYQILKQCGAESDNAYLLNKLVIFYREQAIKEQRCNCFHIAKKDNEISEKLMMELENRGFYDEFR